MLSDQDLLKVQGVGSDLSLPVTLLIYSPATEGPFEKNLVNTARQIAGVSSPVVELKDDNDPPYADNASITLSSDRGSGIHYLAAPEGPELAPFLDAIAWLGQETAGEPSKLHKSLQALTQPVTVMVLIAPICPHCPGLVRKVIFMAVNQPLIRVVVADAVELAEFTERYKVKSTPTLIFNDAATLVGDVTEEEIVRQILRCGDVGSLTETLDSMIKAGRAEAAAALMCAENRPEALLPIYVSPELSARIGAMVVMEEALAADPRSLDSLVEDLELLLLKDDARLRGDTAELLGRIGDPRAIPSLKKLAGDPDPDVREAAEEALEGLESRDGSRVV